MKAATWLGAVVVLGIVVLAGCGSNDSPPSAPSAPSPPPGPPPSGPGMGPMGPAMPAAVEQAKPKTDAKADDDSDDPWFGEKKTVTGAVGKALLRGLTGGAAGPKKEELPVLIK